MSNGADNFFKSDKVTVQKVSFKNQYQLNVVGNLFIPKGLDSATLSPAIIVGHPMGAVKEQPTLSSNTKFMNFYPFADIESISPRPMLFIAGENAHSREFSEEAFRLAGEPKELVIVPNAGHVDLYDRVDLIPFAKLTQFFQVHLK